MPALAIVTVCCSIALWMATRSFSPILSNSSTHTRPHSRDHGASFQAALVGIGIRGDSCGQTNTGTSLLVVRFLWLVALFFFIFLKPFDKPILAHGVRATPFRLAGIPSVDASDTPCTGDGAGFFVALFDCCSSFRPVIVIVVVIVLRGIQQLSPPLHGKRPFLLKA